MLYADNVIPSDKSDETLQMLDTVIGYRKDIYMKFNNREEVGVNQEGGRGAMGLPGYSAWLLPERV